MKPVYFKKILKNSRISHNFRTKFFGKFQILENSQKI